MKSQPILHEFYFKEMRNDLLTHPGLEAELDAKLLDCGDLMGIPFQYSRKKPDIADKFIALKLSRALSVGEVATLAVDVGEGPKADREVEANDTTLKSLPHPFAGTFAPGDSVGLIDTDGAVSWSEPIKFHCGGKSVMVPPMSLPLEVGYMPSVKTDYAILGSLMPGLARWPYGSSSVFLHVNMKTVRMD